MGVSNLELFVKTVKPDFGLKKVELREIINNER